MMAQANQSTQGVLSLLQQINEIISLEYIVKARRTLNSTGFLGEGIEYVDKSESAVLIIDLDNTIR